MIQSIDRGRIRVILILISISSIIKTIFGDCPYINVLSAQETW
jgi:hypothetical protein